MLWLDTQVLSVAVMFLTGAGLGLALDLAAVLAGRLGAPPGRRVRRPRRRRAGSGLWDVFVWLVAAPLVLGAIVVSNRGELRFYVFVGLGLGLCTYALLARRVWVWALAAARGTLVRGAQEAARAAARPTRAAAGWVTHRTEELRGWTRGRAGWVRAWVKARGAVAAGVGRRILAGFRPRPKE